MADRDPGTSGAVGRRRGRWRRWRGAVREVLGRAVTRAAGAGRGPWPLFALVLLSVALSSVLWQAWRARGVAGAVAALGVATSGLAGFAVLALVFSTRVTGLPALTLAALWAFERYVGAYHLAVDAVVVLLAALCAVGSGWQVARWRRRRGRVISWGARVGAGVPAFWLAFWLLVSGADALVDGAPIREPATRGAPRPLPAAWPAARVGLALSGGGYRAALFHAGVVHVLDSLQTPLFSMSTVSGGSLFGAFYATGGEPGGFRDAMLARRFNLKREAFHVQHLARLVLASRILFTPYRVLPVPDFDRTGVQAAMLDRLFLRGVPFRALAAAPADDTTHVPWRPELVVCATDILHANIVGITARGVVEVPIPGAQNRFNTIVLREPKKPGFLSGRPEGLPGVQRLSAFVAASGAFPFAFKPLRTPVWYSRGDTNVYVLADGGLADNLGLVVLGAARETAAWSKFDDGGYTGGYLYPFDVNVVVASDASAIDPVREPGTGLAEVSRAIDVVYRATAGEQLGGGSEFRFPPTIVVSPATVLEPPDLTTGPRSLARAAPPRERPGAADSLVTLSFEGGGSDTLDVVTEPVLPRGATQSADYVFVRHFRPPTYWSLNERALAFLVAHMDDLTAADRAGTRAALADVTRRYAALPSPDSRARAAGAGDADRVLYRRVVHELARRASVFLRTSTLDDQLPASDVESLYLFGAYMTLLNEPYLQYQLRHVGQGGAGAAHPAARRGVADGRSEVVAR